MTREVVEEARRLAVNSGLFRTTRKGLERREVKGQSWDDRWYAAPEVGLEMRILSLVMDKAEAIDDGSRDIRVQISLDEFVTRMQATPEEITQVITSKVFTDLVEVQGDVYRPRLEQVPEDYGDDPDGWEPDDAA